MVHRFFSAEAGLEHEAFLRAPFAAPVQFWVGQPTTTPGLGAARELSVGGLSFESDDVLTSGTRVHLQFVVDARPLSVTGEVVRVAKGGVLFAAGMGLKFIDLTADDSRAIIEYVVRSRG